MVILVRGLYQWMIIFALMLREPAALTVTLANPMRMRLEFSTGTVPGLRLMR